MDAPAATVRERIGRWSTVEEVDAEHCRVRMTTDSLDWPTLALGVSAPSSTCSNRPNWSTNSATGQPGSTGPDRADSSHAGMLRPPATGGTDDLVAHACADLGRSKPQSTASDGSR